MPKLLERVAGLPGSGSPWAGSPPVPATNPTEARPFRLMLVEESLQKLVDAGNTVVVIEHNLDVIKTADHIIDLGPEGGNKGGTIVAEGTPEEIAECRDSYTGQYLKKVLKT